jgi:glycosyltransferase involved in cell wall biosynthesis
VRLAWFSPWPPQRSGVAGRSAELVPILAARGHAMDVFVDASRLRLAPVSDAPPAPGSVRVLSAHDFVWRHRRHPYDLPVYQVGNSHLHRFIWAYLFRYPGLAVLHDGRLHHARAEALVPHARTKDYRAEFAWNHPDVPPEAAEFAALGLDGILYYQWPMLRGVVESARLVAAHSPGVVSMIAQQWPGRPLEHIALGEGPANLDVPAASHAFRAAHNIPADAIVFGVHGGLTAEKRARDVVAAFAAIRSSVPGAHLLLVGAADPWLDLEDQITSLGLTEAVSRVVVADDETFDRSIAACDVTLNLRWPTALETSGPWVRSLAMGRATVIIDAAHQAHVPSLDPRTWRLQAPPRDLEPGADGRAVTVAIDLRQLSSSLALAMGRLGGDAALRTAIGREARRWWEREHTVERMTQDYERAIARAVHEPEPVVSGWPSHMRPDPASHTRALLDDVGLSDGLVGERLAGFDS